MTTKTFADSNFGSHALKLIIHVTWLEVGVNAKGSRVTVLTANNMMHENSFSNPNNVRGWLLFTSSLVLQPSEYLYKCQCKQFYNFETCKLGQLKFCLEMMQVVLTTDGQQAMMLKFSLFNFLSYFEEANLLLAVVETYRYFTISSVVIVLLVE